MLVLRDEQIETLNAHRRQSFERRLSAHLQALFPDRVGSEAERLALIRQGLQKAAGYGITAERDVASFIELMMRWGPRFEQREELAWAASLLAGTALSAGAKLQRIHEELKRRAL